MTIESRDESDRDRVIDRIAVAVAMIIWAGLIAWAGLQHSSDRSGFEVFIAEEAQIRIDAIFSSSPENGTIACLLGRCRNGSCLIADAYLPELLLADSHDIWFSCRVNDSLPENLIGNMHQLQSGPCRPSDPDLGTLEFQTLQRGKSIMGIRCGRLQRFWTLGENRTLLRGEVRQAVATPSFLLSE